MRKRLRHRATLKAERIDDQLFNRTGKGREIDAGIDAATPDQIALRGCSQIMPRHAWSVPPKT